ncbi:MAG: ABC transporter ATP-binding protein [Alphaproteobacteria bacterium]|nr:ABC transporter ATP-binding protein [Alphaproteobacteria bacterium]
MSESAAPSTAPVIEVSDLSVKLPEGADRTFAVEGANFSIREGETLCLVGESGSGKSVLAQTIMGMLPPQLNLSEGDIRFCGDPLPPQRSSAFETLRSRRLAMIFQDAAASLDPIQRVGHQLEEILQVHGITDRRERNRRVMDLLDAVQLPDPERIYRSYPHQISGGQAQRIVIAGALALGPELLIADEPTTALDVTTQAEILHLVAQLAKTRNAAVMFITHDIGVVAEIADTVAVMCEGKIVETGSRDAVLTQPQHPYTRRLLDAVPKPAEAGSMKVREPVLTVDGLSRIYHIKTGPFSHAPLKALRDVSFSLGPAETLGVVGESGSGKSTLARCLLRLEEPDSGRILFEGSDIMTARGSQMQNLRAKLQIVLQDPYSALDPRQSIGSAIAEGPVIHGASHSDAMHRVDELLDLVGLPKMAAERYPHEFSGGQRQRICIARALALEPQILIADEAVSALDVSIQAQILQLFQDLQEAMGFAMIFITHDLMVAAAICDNVLVMRKGAVVERGPAADIFHAPKEPYTRDLVGAVPGGLYGVLSGQKQATGTEAQT